MFLEKQISFSYIRSKYILLIIFGIQTLRYLKKIRLDSALTRRLTFRIVFIMEDIILQ